MLSPKDKDEKKYVMKEHTLYLLLLVCVRLCVYFLSAQNPIKLESHCFDATPSIQSNYEKPVKRNSQTLCILEKNDTKEVVNKITDEDATTFNFVRHLKLHKER